MSDHPPLSGVVHPYRGRLYIKVGQQLSSETTEYFMPPTYSIWTRNTTTTIILVDGPGNINMVRGNLRHIDRSNTIRIIDSFNIVESTITGQLSTTSLGKLIILVLNIQSTEL